MYEEKFREVKYEDVVDECGYVIDLDLAKYLIYLTYYDNKNSYVQDWVKECQKSLKQFEKGEFSLWNSETESFSLGGPGGYSGYMFQEFNKYCEDEFPENNHDLWGIGCEETVNEYPKVFVIIENKPRLFIIRETD